MMGEPTRGRSPGVLTERGAYQRYGKPPARREDIQDTAGRGKGTGRTPGVLTERGAYQRYGDPPTRSGDTQDFAGTGKGKVAVGSSENKFAAMRAVFERGSAGSEESKPAAPPRRGRRSMEPGAKRPDSWSLKDKPADTSEKPAVTKSRREDDKNTAAEKLKLSSDRTVNQTSVLSHGKAADDRQASTGRERANRPSKSPEQVFTRRSSRDNVLRKRETSSPLEEDAATSKRSETNSKLVNGLSDEEHAEKTPPKVVSGHVRDETVIRRKDNTTEEWASAEMGDEQNQKTSSGRSVTQKTAVSHGRGSVTEEVVFVDSEEVTSEEASENVFPKERSFRGHPNASVDPQEGRVEVASMPTRRRDVVTPNDVDGDVTPTRRRSKRTDAPNTNSDVLHISENGTSAKSRSKPTDVTEDGVSDRTESEKPTPKPRRSRITRSPDVAMETKMASERTDGADRVNVDAHKDEVVQNGTAIQRRRKINVDVDDGGEKAMATSVPRRNRPTPSVDVDAKKTSVHTDGTENVDINVKARELALNETSVQRRRHGDLDTQTSNESRLLARSDGAEDVQEWVQQRRTSVQRRRKLGDDVEDVTSTSLRHQSSAGSGGEETTDDSRPSVLTEGTNNVVDRVGAGKATEDERYKEHRRNGDASVENDTSTKAEKSTERRRNGAASIENDISTEAQKSTVKVRELVQNGTSIQRRREVDVSVDKIGQNGTSTSILHRNGVNGDAETSKENRTSALTGDIDMNVDKVIQSETSAERQRKVGVQESSDNVASIRRGNINNGAPTEDTSEDAPSETSNGVEKMDQRELSSLRRGSGDGSENGTTTRRGSRINRTPAEDGSQGVPSETSNADKMMQKESSIQRGRNGDGSETGTSTRRPSRINRTRTEDANEDVQSDTSNGVNADKLIQKEASIQRGRNGDPSENGTSTRRGSRINRTPGEDVSECVPSETSNADKMMQKESSIQRGRNGDGSETGSSTRRPSRINRTPAEDASEDVASEKIIQKEQPIQRGRNGDGSENGGSTRRRSRIAAEIEDVDAELARPRYRRRDRDADGDLDAPRRRGRNSDAMLTRSRSTILPEDGTLELNSAAYGKVATLQWGFRAPGYADRLERRRPLEKMNGEEMALRGALLSGDVDKIRTMVTSWPHKVLDFRNVYGQSGISTLQNGHVSNDQSDEVAVFPKRPIEYSNPAVSWSRDVTKAVLEGLTTKQNSGFEAVCMQNVLPDKDMTNDFATAALDAEKETTKMEGSLDVYLNVWLKWGYSNSEKLTKALAAGRRGEARMRLHASTAVVHRAHRCYKFVGELINTLDPEVTTGFEVYENEADLEEKFKDIIKLKNLTSLTLAGCLPEGTSPEYLQTLVSSMPNLRRLDVRRNPLTGWFAELLGTASPLQYLNIAQCGVSQIDLYFLANSHHIAQLEELDLSGTDLTPLRDDVTQLLQQASGNLKWLGTAECNLGAHAHTVLDLLEKLPYLEEWDLNDNEFCEEDVCKIVEACAKAPGFRFLKITPPGTVNSADPKEGSKEVRRFDGLVKAALRRACADEDRKMRCLVTYKLPEYKDEPPTLI